MGFLRKCFSSYINMHFFGTICKKWLQTYLLATIWGGRRCKPNFVLTLLNKRKTHFFSKPSYNSEFCVALSLYVQGSNDIKIIVSCCSVVSLYSYCAFRFVLVCTVHSIALILMYSSVFCCALPSILYISFRSFTNTVNYVLLPSIPRAVSTVQHAVKQHCHLPQADVTNP